MAKAKKDENVEGVNDQANAGNDAVETVAITADEVGNAEDALGLEGQKPDEPMDATVVPAELESFRNPFETLADPDKAKLYLKVMGVMGFESIDRAKEAVKCLAQSECGTFGDLIGSEKNNNFAIRKLLNNAMARAEKPKVEKG